ncbi:MAG: GNAT family N-acetyltransferase [Sedimentisphaerales bacterium]|nr:GNAT family N-acetyltransferase [Sedimentisphaerales bacterium]
MKQLRTTLEGNHIIIRKLRAADAGDIYKNIRTRQISRWTLLLPWPYPKDGAIKFIRNQQRLWRLGKGYAFGIILKDTGEVIGGLGLGKVDKKHKCAEVGYWLGRKYWRQGIMTEAVRLLLEFGFTDLKLYRIYSHIFEPNTASRRVLEKCGFQKEGVMRQAVIKYKNRQNLINYGLLLPEWKKKKKSTD